MDCKAYFLLAVLCAQNVLCSYSHGPTASPVVLKSGYLADTHEVAAAKSAHLAALAKDSHYGHGGDYSGSYGYGGDYVRSYGHAYTAKYHGPTAIPRVLKSGYLADTHEVAAAKGAHLAALAKESHYRHGGDFSGSYSRGGDYDHSYGHGYGIKYHGPTAAPYVLNNGHFADTHEVSAAASEHYAAVAVAQSRGYGYSLGHGEH